MGHPEAFMDRRDFLAELSSQLAVYCAAFSSDAMAVQHLASIAPRAL